MVPEHYRNLVEKLKMKTQNGQAVWNKTSGENEFKLDLGQGTITTDKWFDPQSKKNFIDLRIWNEKGDCIDTFKVAKIDNIQDFDYLLDLHNMARKAYFKVDETFRNILKELDSDKTIGKDPEADLPF
jgi:hypothetical protein